MPGWVWSQEALDMERIDKILKNELFLKNLALNEEAEADRLFCRHNMVHFLDVARIARILNAEETYGLDVELIYAAALLHDIGKHMQYSDGIPHEKASAAIAPRILLECGFDSEETVAIIEAILKHRDSEVKSRRDLNGLLYRADKLSRACFSCKMQEECNWKDGKKNLSIKY